MRFCVVFLTVWTASVPPNCSSANERASWPRWDESSNNVFKNPAFSPQVWRCVCVCAAEGLRVIWTRNYYYCCCLYFIIIFLSVALLFYVAAKKLENEKDFLNKTVSGQKSKKNWRLAQFFWESVKFMRKVEQHFSNQKCLEFWLCVTECPEVLERLRACGQETSQLTNTTFLKETQ